MSRPGKKIIIIFLLTVIVVCFNYYPVNGQIIPLAMIDRAEEIIYGQASTLPIKERIEQLEFTLYNQHGTESLKEKADKIVQYVLVAEDRPSLVFLFNVLEWTLSNRISQGSLIYRLAELEQVVFGMTQKGALVNRVKQLEELSLPAGQIKQQEVVLAENVGIVVTLLKEIDSARVEAGDLIRYRVEENIKVGNTLVVAAGTTGAIRINKVDQAGNFGRDGQVSFAESGLIAIDGSVIPVKVIDDQDDSSSQDIAVGLSLLGTVIVSHPLGLLAGLFYNGKEAVIPAGSSFRVITTGSVTISGLAL